MASIPPNLCVPPGTIIRLTLKAITKNGRQVALVTDPDDRLLGIVTDGDVRKALDARDVRAREPQLARRDMPPAQWETLMAGLGPSTRGVDISAYQFAP